MIVKTRENDNGGLDVVLLGCDFKQTVAIRNGLSSVDNNRKWAIRWGTGVMEAIRNSPGLRSTHEEFKSTVRDNPSDPSDIDPEEVLEDDEFETWE